MSSSSEDEFTMCLCRQDRSVVDEERWFLNPDPLGCPAHRPTKRYCKFHHVGFYGNCPDCARYDLKQLLKQILEAVLQS